LKKSEVHKVLTELMGRGTSPKSAINLIDTFSQREPITGIKTKKSIFFITMEIERTVTYKNQRNKKYDVDDKVIKSVKVNAKNETQAKQKAKAETETDLDGVVALLIHLNR